MSTGKQPKPNAEEKLPAAGGNNLFAARPPDVGLNPVAHPCTKETRFTKP